MSAPSGRSSARSPTEAASEPVRARSPSFGLPLPGRISVDARRKRTCNQWRRLPLVQRQADTPASSSAASLIPAVRTRASWELSADGSTEGSEVPRFIVNSLIRPKRPSTWLACRSIMRFSKRSIKMNMMVAPMIIPPTRNISSWMNTRDSSKCQFTHQQVYFIALWS